MMSETPEQLYQEREKRVMDAITLISQTECLFGAHLIFYYKIRRKHRKKRELLPMAVEIGVVGAERSGNPQVFIALHLSRNHARCTRGEDILHL